MRTRYAPSLSSPPARVASATLSGGATSGTCHGTLAGGTMIVWAGLSLDMTLIPSDSALCARPISRLDLGVAQGHGLLGCFPFRSTAVKISKRQAASAVQ